MAGEKIDLVLKTCKFLVDQLAPQDSFSIVSYDTQVKVDLPLCKMEDTNKVLRISANHLVDHRRLVHSNAWKE